MPIMNISLLLPFMVEMGFFDGRFPAIEKLKGRKAIIFFHLLSRLISPSKSFSFLNF
jgi:hypothetical protein